VARRKEAAQGGHGWFVTFADLMGLLVSFFVMLVAFSTQDAKKMQIATGSMHDAFGVQKQANYSGVVEDDGSPMRNKVKHAARIAPKLSSVSPTDDQKGKDAKRSQSLALVAAALRRALENMPELTETSKHIMVEESRDGLNISIVDQNGKSMFQEGSSAPTAYGREVFRKLAAPLKALPYRIAIAGHTSRSDSWQQDYGPWALSVDRANSVRRILEEEGYPSQNIFKVEGKADTDALLPEDPSSAPNRRVTMTLINEAPPLPADLQP
jgi:chemotaxis protein MotB